MAKETSVSPPEGDFLGLFEEVDQTFRLNEIHSRQVFDDRKKALLSLAMVAGKCQTDAVPTHVRMCIKAGLGKTEIGELFLQVYCYAGVYAALSSFNAARETLDAMELAGELPGLLQKVVNRRAPSQTVAERIAHGALMRSDLFGGANAGRSKPDPFIDLFWETTLDFCFGNIWSRPTFDRKLRSEICLAIASATGQTGAVDRHVRSAVLGGVSREHIAEIFLLAYVYGGAYNSLASFNMAQDVFSEMDSIKKRAREKAVSLSTSRRNASKKNGGKGI